MSTTPTPGRRRAFVTLTAAVAAVATVAGLGFLGLTATPSTASASVEAQAAGTSALVPAVDANPADSAGGSASPNATPSGSPTAPTTGTSATGTVSDITNVVLVLADDLDWTLFEQIPRLAALKDAGMTFTQHTVTDSLCCPSRTSIMRGQYIHNHLVVSNSAKTGGGWPTFFKRHEQRDCLPVWLDNAGATTGLFGKYLNDYPASRKSARLVPPGWDQWGVPVSKGESYDGYNYTLNSNGRLVRYGKKPSDFLNDVITTKATDFIRTAPDGFFLELSTYNPHKPSPVATRHKGTHLTAIAPRTPSYNTPGTNEPTWLRDEPLISPWRQARLDLLWRQRAQSAESVADSVDSVLSTLQATGHADDTLVIVTSDNGYHVGSHRLTNGKRTAFREDTVVPMIAIGPGITPGTHIDAMTSTIDLAPTITQLMGTQAPAWTDGRSLVDILTTGTTPANWRHAALSESLGISGPDDPDYQADAPPQFSALRTPDWLFVVYRTGERELYDLNADPNEMDNIAATADTKLVANLYSQLQAMRTCAGDSCRTADAIVLPDVSS